MGVGRGDLDGRSPTVNEKDLNRFLELSGRPDAHAQIEAFIEAGGTKGAHWQRQTTRDFWVPAGLAFLGFGCESGDPDASASCLDHGRRLPTTKMGTYVGTYQPYVYLGPGLAMRSTRDGPTAMRLGRLANAVLSLGLVAIAALALWDRSRGALSLAGVIVAVSPAVVFAATTLNPSGPEIAAGICFAASLMRLTRSADRPTWIWVAYGASGAVLALSRSLGPIFVVLIALAIALLVGRRGVRAVLGTEPWRARTAAAAIAVAIAGGLFWELTYQPHLPFDVGATLDEVGPSVTALPRLAKEAVGVFGALDTKLPLAAYVGWWLMLGVLLVVAFAVAERRERRALAALGVGVVAVAIGVSTIYRQTGFALQARYVLPVAVVLPLWAGELLTRHHRSLSPSGSRALLIVLTAAAAGIHALAWYTNARRAAVGVDGGWLFERHPEWSPPLGWLPWIALVLVAAASCMLAGVRTTRALE